jgi:hypothetical protein
MEEKTPRVLSSKTGLGPWRMSQSDTIRCTKDAISNTGLVFGAIRELTRLGRRDAKAVSTLMHADSRMLVWSGANASVTHSKLRFHQDKHTIGHSRFIHVHSRTLQVSSAI